MKFCRFKGALDLAADMFTEGLGHMAYNSVKFVLEKCKKLMCILFSCFHMG